MARGKHSRLAQPSKQPGTREQSRPQLQHGPDQPTICIPKFTSPHEPRNTASIAENETWNGLPALDARQLNDDGRNSHLDSTTRIPLQQGITRGVELSGRRVQAAQ